MDLKVNRQSELPLHLQLKAQVKHLIRAGRLVPGQRMPTVRRLAPPGKEIIVDDRTLDKGGLEMLRGVVERLEREGWGVSGGRVRPGRGRRPRALGR